MEADIWMLAAGILVAEIHVITGSSFASYEGERSNIHDIECQKLIQLS